MGTSSLKLLLDQIDSVRHALSGLKNRNGNQLFYEKLLSSLPQFVVCGPQSAGKSSVIRQVSGIALPVASTVCTRIATIIQLRREPQAAVRVSLLGPDAIECWGQQVEGGDLHDEDRARNLVRMAQEDAIEKSGNVQFVDDYTILVAVCGPDRHNVTLVDLPGFHTSSDEDSKTVNDMVRRYIEMPGTLVLHVIRGDQDYDSILGNDFMRNHKIDRVTVLTHCDKVAVGSEEMSLLETTLGKTLNTSSMTFAVDGKAKSEAEETEHLKHLAVLEDEHENFDIGAKPLGQHLEKRMGRHLEKQMPIAADELRTALHDTNAALRELERKSPNRELFEFVECLRTKFREERKILMNEVRELVMKVAEEVGNYIRWCPEDGSALQKFDDPDELRPGTYVYVKVKRGGELERVCVTSREADLVFWRKTDAGNKVLQSGNTKMSQVWRQDASASTMSEEIRLLAHDRGTRNLLHVDRQQIIAVYMKRSAQHWVKILSDAGYALRSMVSKMIDGVFSAAADSRTTALAKELRRRVSQLEVESHAKLEEAFKVLETHHTHPDLLFTTDEDYFDELVEQMARKDADRATDSWFLRHIYHDVRAFLMVERKQVCETAAKELVRIGVLLFEESFDQLMRSDLSDCHQLLEDERESVTKQRAKLQERKRVLEHAVAAL